MRPPKKFDIDQQHQNLLKPRLDEMQLKNATFTPTSPNSQLNKHLQMDRKLKYSGHKLSIFESFS